MSVNIYLDGKLSPVTGEMYQNPALVPDKVADGAVMEKPTGDEVLVTQDSSGTVKAKNFLLDGKQVATKESNGYVAKALLARGLEDGAQMGESPIATKKNSIILNNPNIFSGDLNTLYESGYYERDTREGSNFPTIERCSIFVFPQTKASSLVCQIIYDRVFNITYMRTIKKDGAGAEWIKSINNNNAFTADGDALVYIKDLPSKDFNDCPLGSSMSAWADYATLKNAPPVEDAYVIWTFKTNAPNDSPARQIAYGRDLNIIFTRINAKKKWSSWQRLATTTDINKIQGRNLMTVLGVSSVREVFDKIRAMNGDYSSLQLGDYVDIESITAGGTTYKNVSGNLRVEIAGFNHYYRVGDTETAMGVLFVFRNCVTTRPMNDLATHEQKHTNAGGYNGCELKKWLNVDFAAGLEKAIGALKTVHRLVDTHGNWTWTGEKCFLPTEIEVFGYQAWGRGGYYSGTSVQFPIYSLDPSRRVKTHNGSRMWWWEGTSDSSSSTNFCDCSNYGRAIYSYAGYSGGVSPAFYI